MKLWIWFILLVLILLVQTDFALARAPSWIKEMPQGCEAYYCAVGIADDETLGMALEKARQSATAEIIRQAFGFSTSVSTNLIAGLSTSHSITSVADSSREVELTGIFIAERYFEENNHRQRVFVLVKYPRNVAERERLRLNAKPQRSKGELARYRIESAPSGATVILDGTIAGKTPIFLQVSAIAHTFELRKKGYLTEARSIAATAKENKSIKIELKPAQGSLSIHVKPNDGKIYIDGVFQKKDSEFYATLATGVHYLKIMSDGYHDYETDFEVSQNELTSLDVEMRETDDEDGNLDSFNSHNYVEHAIYKNRTYYYELYKRTFHLGLDVVLRNLEEWSKKFPDDDAPNVLSCEAMNSHKKFVMLLKKCSIKNINNENYKARVEFVICQAQAELGDYAFAQSACLSAIEMDGTKGEYYYFLGQLYEKQHRYSDAFKLYRTAHFFDPKFPSHERRLCSKFESRMKVSECRL